MGSFLSCWRNIFTLSNLFNVLCFNFDKCGKLLRHTKNIPRSLHKNSLGFCEIRHALKDLLCLFTVNYKTVRWIALNKSIQTI